MTPADKKSEIISIKGTAGGLLIRIREDGEASFQEILSELDERLQAGDRFFRQGHATLELGNRILEQADLETLKKLLTKHEVEFHEIVSGAYATRTVAKEAGVEYQIPTSQNTRPAAPQFDADAGVLVSVKEKETFITPANRVPMPFDSAEALLIRRTLRGGQIVRHHADVILIGDINAGAEIIAGGSVIVWGTVRGRIQAGIGATASDAMICALSLRPTQLTIGEVIAVGETDTHSEPELGPEMATIQDGNIVVESWMPRRAGGRYLT